MTTIADSTALLDVAALRAAEFPWMLSGEQAYLNNAGIGPLPARTVRALDEFNRLRAEPYRLTQAYQFGMLSRARELSARLIGATPGEIALMVNTTYGINVAARCLPLVAGDVILTVDREFPANVLPWMALERDGIEYRRLPCVNDWPDEEALLDAIANEPRAKVVTVSWVSFASGYRVDLARIGAACRARGLVFVVDGIQALGAFPVDVAACNIDIFACGAQKWLLSPWGTGFVYIRRELVRQLDPNPVGWMAPKGTDDFSKMLDYHLDWRDDARRFEVITLPFQDFCGYNASVGLLLELGIDRIARHVEGLVTDAIAWAGAHGLRVATPADPARRAGVVGIVPAGEAKAASKRLVGAGVSHAVREGAVRLSPHCFSTAQDMMRALEILAER
jgi:cysteine desulfurase/selenocysteine lyase